MSALLAEGYRHYHPSDVSTTTRMMSLPSCVKYSRPFSCMSKTIRAMSALSSELCHHYHQADVRHMSPRQSAFLMAFLFVLPMVWLGILQIKVPSLPFLFTNYLYSMISFPLVDSFEFYKLEYLRTIALATSKLFFRRITLYAHIFAGRYCSLL